MSTATLLFSAKPALLCFWWASQQKSCWPPSPSQLQEAPKEAAVQGNIRADMKKGYYNLITLLPSLQHSEVSGKLWLSKSHSGCLSYKGCIHLPQTQGCHIGNPAMSCPVSWCCIRRTRLLWAPLVCKVHADVWTFAKRVKQQKIDILSVSELCLDGDRVKEECTVVTSSVSVSVVEKCPFYIRK